MRKLHVIGIGAGNPDHLTIQAINALNEVDIFFIPDKGAEKEDLRRLRREICERFIRDPDYRTVEFRVPHRRKDGAYRDNVEDWHAAIAATYARLLTEHLGEGECGAFLVWGDPCLYDSTLRIVERLQAEGVALEVEVIPGISSIQALAARHRIALNRIGRPVAIVPGRRLADGFPDDIDDVVVVLDGEAAYRHVQEDDPDIYWGAYVGTEDECLIAGRLADVMNDIERVRAAKKKEKGWVMDSYLLRRSKPGGR